MHPIRRPYMRVNELSLFSKGNSMSRVQKTCDITSCVCPYPLYVDVAGFLFFFRTISIGNRLRQLFDSIPCATYMNANKTSICRCSRVMSRKCSTLHLTRPSYVYVSGYSAYTMLAHLQNANILVNVCLFAYNNKN